MQLDGFEFLFILTVLADYKVFQSNLERIDSLYGIEYLNMHMTVFDYFDHDDFAGLHRVTVGPSRPAAVCAARPGRSFW